MAKTYSFVLCVVKYSGFTQSIDIKLGRKKKKSTGTQKSMWFGRLVLGLQLWVAMRRIFLLRKYGNYNM